MLRLPILNALLIYIYLLFLSIKNQPLTGCERLICIISYEVFVSTNWKLVIYLAFLCIISLMTKQMITTMINVIRLGIDL